MEQQVVPTWAEIGGLREAKERIEEIFGVTQRYAMLFKGRKTSQGLMLYGPPGCGKTYVASSIAKKFGMNFISVKGPELLNKYIGASEQNVREVFEKAQASAPSILFFDEFDSLAPKRGEGSTSVTDRIVNQFLCYLDGVEGRDGVFVLAASARPDMIDVALLRPGRIDKSVYCGFPELEDRKQIVEIYLNKNKYQKQSEEQHERFITELAQKTDGFTSADLKGLVQNAILAKTSNLMKQDPDSVLELELVEADVWEALKTFVKGLKPEEKARFEAIYERYKDKDGTKKHLKEQVGKQKQTLY